MTLRGRLLLAALRENAGANGRVWYGHAITYARMAKWFQGEASERSVRRWMAELREAGVVRVQHARMKQGMHITMVSDAERELATRQMALFSEINHTRKPSKRSAECQATGREARQAISTVASAAKNYAVGRGERAVKNPVEKQRNSGVPRSFPQVLDRPPVAGRAAKFGRRKKAFEFREAFNNQKQGQKPLADARAFSLSDEKTGNRPAWDAATRLERLGPTRTRLPAELRERFLKAVNARGWPP